MRVRVSSHSLLRPGPKLHSMAPIHLSGHQASFEEPSTCAVLSRLLRCMCVCACVRARARARGVCVCILSVSLCLCLCVRIYVCVPTKSGEALPMEEGEFVLRFLKFVRSHGRPQPVQRACAWRPGQLVHRFGSDLSGWGMVGRMVTRVKMLVRASVGMGLRVSLIKTFRIHNHPRAHATKHDRNEPSPMKTKQFPTGSPT